MNWDNASTVFRVAGSEFQTDGAMKLKEPENVKLFEESASKIPLLAIRELLHLEKSKISLDLIDDASCLDITPWTLSVRIVRFALTKFFKKTQLTMKPRNSFICSLLQNSLRQN